MHRRRRLLTPRLLTVCLQPENIVTLTKAAGIEVEPYWPGLFAKLVEKKGVEEFIVNVGAGERGAGMRRPAHQQAAAPR